MQAPTASSRPRAVSRSPTRQTQRGIGYVLAVASSAEMTTGAGTFRADALAAMVPKRAWQKLSAGPGAKGHRFYDWAVVDLAELAAGRLQLLIRRNLPEQEWTGGTRRTPGPPLPLGFAQIPRGGVGTCRGPGPTLLAPLSAWRTAPPPGDGVAERQPSGQPLVASALLRQDVEGGLASSAGTVLWRPDRPVRGDRWRRNMTAVPGRRDERQARF